MDVSRKSTSDNQVAGVETAREEDIMVTSAPLPITLSWPTADAGKGPVVGWMQVVKTGSFTSKAYGKFSITRADLAQMLLNFKTVTPIPPTRLPIDYDHLSMSPQRPGDGIAAGWIIDLQLRASGDELWAQIEWTSEGARRVKAKEYQFVSPSFVKDYIYKTGEKIGTTLIAAAITNHPFLEGMAAIALTNRGEHQLPDRGLSLGADSVSANTFVALVSQVAREKRIDLRSAVKEVARERPDLAEAYERGGGL